MENRERDRVSQRSSSTEVGDVNRRTEEEKGRENSGTGAEFGQNIGRSENLSEGENMENRNKSNIGNMEENEQSRRPSGDQGFGSSQGRSSGSSDSSSIDRSGNLDENESSRSDRGSMGRTSNVDRSSEGRH